MAKPIRALVNKELLVWARKTAGYPDTSVPAKKIGVPITTLESWEHGTSLPSIAKARRLAEVYKRPFAVFFMPHVPRGYNVIKEYRRLAGTKIEQESPALRFALQIAEFRREAFLESLGDDETVTTFGGEAKLSEDPEAVGARLRTLLGVRLETQQKWNTGYEALAGWRRAAENQGVLVFQPPRVSMNEMRGAIIPHANTPIVLLNSKDAPYGRVFTLAHELIHLWLVRGGHNTGSSERHQSVENQPTEVFCNAAAAATLLPKQEFLHDSDVVLSAERSPQDLSLMKSIASRYGVSAETVARRLSALGLISTSEYDRLRKEGRFGAHRRGRPGPVKIELRVLAQVGIPFAEAVIAAYYRDQLTGNRLSDYLGAKLKYLPKIERRLGGGIHQSAEVEAAAG
jgi:Zn-dependent peptidase ImmA (M78 family)